MLLGVTGSMDHSLLNPLGSPPYYNSEQECRDQMNAQAGAQNYHTGGSDQLRRDDSLNRPQPRSYTAGASNNSQYIGDKSSTADIQSRLPSGSTNFILTDGSGTISSATTPVSASSSLVQHFTPSYQLGQQHQYFLPLNFSQRSAEESETHYSGWRADTSAIHPVSPSTVSREGYTYPTAPTHLMPSNLAYAGGNSAYSTSPRSGDTSLAQPFTPATSLFDPTDMSNSGEQSHMFPFLAMETERSIVTSTGDIVKPNIQVMPTKGFFTAQGHWTCYRRNYFGLNAWYDLGFLAHNTLLYLDSKPIKAFALHLSATIDGQEGKNVELVQYTPKRDLGDKTPIAITRVAPSSPGVPPSMNPNSTYVGMSAYQLNGMYGCPFLPLQNERDPESPETPNSANQLSMSPTSSGFPHGSGSVQGDIPRHSFDRVQFKGATQNNGKRRASQQFYILVVELLADVRGDDANEPDWTRVASRPSDKLVVRGRSPSHYKDSDQSANSHGRRGGNPGTYDVRGPGHGSPGGGQNGATPYNTGSGNPGAFRPYSYSHSSMSPNSNYSVNNPLNNGEPIVDVKHHLEPSLAREELAHMQNHDTYRYYRDTIDKGIPIPLKIETPSSIIVPGFSTSMQIDSKPAPTEGYPSPAPSRHYGCGSYTGYIGSETSRGWYFTSREDMPY
ncbi:hypothetical protein AAFC00_004602 [Neodothiora populina]|uniref:NDT80 domain-containing protein n=1 Tax=Neodothiora populina TaxID=2781224 RepID=A0ABR3P3D2_9PEZI